ncbi:MAG: tRNA (adenosine(37)-N6)-threonylcarbamoyltransferase complex dimerization subunit type 1 TsaB [Hyphomicrobiaceae bacterium]|nr:tRNA (adenosine(37)-N6)-threonylcarbamoyltransferase complex dimerization subunit type 1 TsaB [Hyphomicrobiaceae bacterium]
MNVLAFDTCLGACSAAVLWSDPAESQARMTCRYEEMAAGHAERLMPMIDEVLRESTRSLTSLDSIVVTEGPGTFTGIRVGVAAARALTLATGLPIRATTSLHVMAHRAKAELAGAAAGRALAVCVDARAGRVFVQTFEVVSGEPMTEAALMSPDAASALSPEAALICVGSGGAAVAEAARRVGREAESRLPALQPDALSLAQLGPALAIHSPLVPLYLRLPDAKPQTGRSLPRA